MKHTFFLYGAAVQGIQNFIFQTNELKDIVGASELVETICTSAFDEFVEAGKDENSIVRAAGNIKYIFEKENKCRKAVLEFPKKIQDMAPGIIISQAVVSLDDIGFSEAMDQLEAKLRSQRNYLMRSSIWGLQGCRRSRKTGLPAVACQNGDFLDEATLKKRKQNEATLRLCEKAFGKSPVKEKDIAFNIEDIATNNNWIAIIHADGNGLGQVVQRIGRDKDRFREFSRKLDELTQKAAVLAFEAIVPLIGDGNTRIPLRPVVLSGDDLTVIIRGDLALPYAKAFLRHFEAITHEQFPGIVKEGKGLTACAGIAFIKSSYPFYYGYDLAEALCSVAKKKAKAIDPLLAPSCLMFHKVQDSFVEDYKEIVARELSPCPGFSFEFGPYFIEEQDSYWSMEQFDSAINELSKEQGNAVKSHLRQWIGLLHQGEDGLGLADQKLRRLLSVLRRNKQIDFVRLVENITLPVEREGIKRFPVLDLLSIYTVNDQVSKK